MKQESTWSDAQLVIAYQGGDRDAWEILYNRHRINLRGYFFRQGIANREDLNDLVQETLLEAMRNIEQLQTPESFSVWLSRIANGILSRWIKIEVNRRKLQNTVGASENTANLGELYAPTYLGPEQRSIDSEYLNIIFGLIEQLPPSEEAAILSHYAGRTNPEIAEELRITVNAAKVRLSRAKKKLKEWLETDYPEVFTDLVGRGII